MSNLSFLLPFLLLLFVPSSFSSLLQVISLYRHGARQPLYNFYNAASFPDQGQLTPVGMRQHFLLGKELRREYIHKLGFLSHQYNSKELVVRSTYVNRTVVSALSQLSGLYPMSTGPKISRKVKKELTLPPFEGVKEKHRPKFALPQGFQAIPITTFPAENDFLLRAYDSKTCPGFSKLIQKQLDSSYYANWTIRYDPNLRELERVLNLSNNSVTVKKAAQIYDVFQNNIWAGNEIPSLSKETWDALEFIYNQDLYFVLFGSEEQKRLVSTPFFEEIVNTFDDRLEADKKNSTSFKWKMFSAHDTTVGMISTGLNITSYECIDKLLAKKSSGIDVVKDDECFLYPEYASNIIIELHDESGNNVVKVRYNGKYVKICGKEERSCPYEEFKQRLNSFKIPNFKEQCLGEKQDERKEENKKSFLSLDV